METDRLRSIRQGPIQHTSRMCVGCRQRDDRSALLRVVVGRPAGGVAPVLVDPRSRLPGRGAWLHPRLACLDLAVRRRAFGRALRVEAALDLRALTAYVASHEQSVVTGSISEPVLETESGLRADEHPMSTQR